MEKVGACGVDAPLPNHSVPLLWGAESQPLEETGGLEGPQAFRPSQAKQFHVAWFLM